MDELDALAKGKALVDEALGRIASPSTQPPAGSGGNADTQRSLSPGQLEPVFMNELMTRRDFFAAAALTGMLAREMDADEDITIPEMAEDAYRYADAMVAAREAKP